MFKALLKDHYSFACHHSVDTMVERMEHSLSNTNTSSFKPNLSGYFISGQEFKVSAARTDFRRIQAAECYGRIIENKEGVFIEVAFRPEGKYIILSWILCFLVMGLVIAIASKHWEAIGFVILALMLLFYANIERDELVENIKKVALYK